ncbi:MAG: hypothetical protein KDK23_10510 [Leptospiraceae bacterium]|nr:hypothetical protein [Leptospiraceae bacterium]
MKSDRTANSGKSRVWSWFWRILLALVVLIIPPFLFSAGAVAYIVAQDYNGICPGIMDIPAYECTVWEFAWRNSLSPFALPFHFLIFLSYWAIAIPGIIAVLIWKWFSENSKIH